MNSQKIHVVVAVVVNDRDEVLIAKRSLHKHEGGKWEFPGGKVEPGEHAKAALKRELQEEVGLTIHDAVPFLQLTYDYPGRSVLLDVYQVTHFSGEAKSNEGQPISWVKRQSLPYCEFPEANQPIVQCLIGLSEESS